MEFKYLCYQIMQMVPMPGLFGPPMGKLWLIKIRIEQDTEDVLVISSINGPALSYWMYSLIQNVQVLWYYVLYAILL